jgi:hypothetical protein
VLAEVVLVLPGVEQVLHQVCFTGQEAKAFGFGDCGPEARSAADRTIAAIGTLSEIEIRLELDGATVTTTSVGLQHWYQLSQQALSICGPTMAFTRR